MSKLQKNIKFTFSDLKDISEMIERDDHDDIIRILNSFSGSNIYEKFKTILRLWEYHVSDTLDFSTDESPVKVQLSYIIDQLPLTLEDKSFEKEGVKYCLSVPTQFTDREESLYVYDIISKLEVYGYTLDMSSLDMEKRKEVIDSLPPHSFNHILESIIDDEGKVLKFDNPRLKDIKINFLTKDPYLFVLGLFSNYGRDYFRGVLFHLSKRIPPNVLFRSDIKDVEYYIEEYGKELKNADATSPDIA